MKKKILISFLFIFIFNLFIFLIPVIPQKYFSTGILRIGFYSSILFVLIITIKFLFVDYSDDIKKNWFGEIFTKVGLIFLFFLPSLIDTYQKDINGIGMALLILFIIIFLFITILITSLKIIFKKDN
ncbi:MAG: hypothetical protein WCG91_00225 [Candidatus Shapirobacteria bacterium]